MKYNESLEYKSFNFELFKHFCMWYMSTNKGYHKIKCENMQVSNLRRGRCSFQDWTSKDDQYTEVHFWSNMAWLANG